VPTISTRTAAVIGALSATLALTCKPKPAPRDALADAGDGGPAAITGPLIPADAGAPTIDGPARVAKGKELYGRYCYLCHGANGEGYAADEAPKLASDDLLSIASDAFLVDAILSGRPGTTMSAWSLAQRGPLGGDDATALVAFFRETWQKRPSENVDARKIDGDKGRGAPLYTTHCASCHGATGSGGKYAWLTNPALLAAASDGFLATTIERGRAGTPMPGFAEKIGPRGAADVVALLRSWPKPVDEKLVFPPRPGALKDVVVHPKGPQPKFDAKADYIKVDDVKAELARGATMIFADARPPSDYARMHIGGAISVPFYEADAYAKQIPKDRWILTYCGCPHAQSGKLRDALRKLGYKRVAVLDEGLNVWRDRGYPVRGGPHP
jgi:cytochrome c oxidase cbb3-type subunit III